METGLAISNSLTNFVIDLPACVSYLILSEIFLRFVYFWCSSCQRPLDRLAYLLLLLTFSHTYALTGLCSRYLTDPFSSHGRTPEKLCSLLSSSYRRGRERETGCLTWLAACCMAATKSSFRIETKATSHPPTDRRRNHRQMTECICGALLWSIWPQRCRRYLRLPPQSPSS